MATYLEVEGNNGQIIIDDETARLHKTRSFSLNLLSPTYTLEPYKTFTDAYLIFKILTYKVILNSNETLFSIRAIKPNENVGFAKCNISAKESYLYCYINKSGNSNFSPSDFIIDVYGTDSQASSNVCGLQIFDETGENIVFDSNRYYMDVKGFYNYNGNPDTYSESFWPDTINIGNPSYKDSAICINNCRHFLYREGLASALHCVVFGNVIYLKFWYFTNARFHEGAPESVRYEVWIAGLNYYPNFSSNNSGIVLDTTNIS